MHYNYIEREVNLMAKKVKLGTIKVTRKVTVKQHVQTQQRSFVNIEPQYTLVTSSSIPKAIESVQHVSPKIETVTKSIVRPSKLPVGVYSPGVEFLYDELEKRRKPEEIEKKAMYDVFISHASEDKKDFVAPLVEALQDAGIRVWYDTLEMEWGKSLREQIDSGIKHSKFAILVLSKNFFAKRWPQRELDGILAKQEITGAMPLPIWYNISFEEVYEFSPTLSGIFSLSNKTHSIQDICKALKLQLEKEKIEN